MAAIASVDDEFQCVLNELVRSYPESLWVPDDSGRTAMELVEILQNMMQDDEEEEEEGRQTVKEMKPVDDLGTKLEKHQYEQELQRHTSKELARRKSKQQQ